MQLLPVFSYFRDNLLAVPKAVYALIFLVVCSRLLSACFNSPASPPVGQSANASTKDADALALAAQSDKCATTGPLFELWQQRNSENNSSDYPVGPGDVLQVTVTDLPEITKSRLRVDGQGSISLPLLGELNVVGLTEDEVSVLIGQRAKTYVRDPRVNVFVQQFASRDVSVMGMVALPGTYALNSPRESILDILGRAGGLKGTGDEPAAQRVVLFPAATGLRQATSAETPPFPRCASNQTGAVTSRAFASNGAPGTASLSTTSDQASGSADPCIPGDQARAIKPTKMDDSAPIQIAASVMPIIIDLAVPSMASCLNLPARPGDIIQVPSEGQVGVYGWVAKPGQFNITPGMTVLGAITGAGGAMFSSNVELLRTLNGKRSSTSLDLSKVEHGQEDDLRVQGGDQVLVKGSAVGAIPYGVYTLLSKFGTGMYLAPAM